MRAKKRTLTREQLLMALSYDPVSGEFRWLTRADQTGQWNGRFAGKVAGWTTRFGYRAIEINGDRHYAHRLAFLAMTGRWPKDEIDHVNLVKDDNRWDNLREATRSDNGANKAVRKDSSTGFKGVQYHKKAGRFAARITARGTVYNLGLFDTPEEASAIYAAAAKALFGAMARS